jgi:hypothetical protein
VQKEEKHTRNPEKIKEKLVKLFGGKCKRCGYDKCYQALTFHHVNPANKLFVISDGYRRRWCDLLAEAQKCELLCLNCHKEIHANMSNTKRKKNEKLVLTKNTRVDILNMVLEDFNEHTTRFEKIDKLGKISIADWAAIINDALGYGTRPNSTQEEQRKTMIRVIALAVMAIEKHDLNSGFAKRFSGKRISAASKKRKEKERGETNNHV